MDEKRPCSRDLYGVREVLCTKSIRGVIAVSLDVWVCAAADLMLAVGIGSLLVMDGQQSLGIRTGRDMVQMARDGLSPRETSVREQSSLH